MKKTKNLLTQSYLGKNVSLIVGREERKINNKPHFLKDSIAVIFNHGANAIAFNHTTQHHIFTTDMYYIGMSHIKFGKI